MRAGYLELAAADPERWVVIDGARPSDAVAAEVLAAVQQRLASHSSG